MNELDLTPFKVDYKDGDNVYPGDIFEMCYRSSGITSLYILIDDWKKIGDGEHDWKMKCADIFDGATVLFDAERIISKYDIPKFKWKPNNE